MNYKFDGSRVFHMNETIIANWNSVVGPDDIIFHLGRLFVWEVLPNG